MYKTILVPIDMGHVNEGKAILDTAIVHDSSSAKIILLNVVAEIPTWIASQLPEGIPENSLHSTQAEMQAIVKSTGIEMAVDIRIGDPSRTILEVAEEKAADLIIIASHQPGLQDYFLGSTAAKVVRHAKCSVLVVR